MALANNIELSEKFFGEKSIILAAAGFGKSYTARVIIEEGLEKGVTFIIIDPQGAYENLKGFENIHFKDIKNIKSFAILLAQTNKNIVISTQRSSIEEQNLFLSKFLQEYRKHKQKGIQTIIIDEIHKFAPNQTKTEAKEEVRAMYQEDRSMGQGVVGISQRPARMDTTIISQANNIAIGRVTSRADKQAILNYLEEKEDIDTVKRLKVGEFFLVGFELDNPEVFKIRKSNTKHSGDSPKHLLTENTSDFDKQVKRFVKKRKMTDEVKTDKEPIKGVIPSREGFMDLIGLGAKIAIGGAVGGIAGGLANRFIPNLGIPVISPRTLGATISTVGLYALWRGLPSRMTRSKDVAKFAAAGSAVFWIGSLVGDGLVAFNIRLPRILQTVLTTTTGAAPAATEEAVEGAKGVQSPDLDTGFQ